MGERLQSLLNDAYEAMEGSEISMEYSARHGIESAAVLTIDTDEMADALADYLAPRVRGKVVVEIGGGIGILALHLGFIAKRVYCIEANPVWASTFVAALLTVKPKNVSYLFGAADEFSDAIRGDVAIFCTHSGVASMRRTAEQFAPIVIDVYGEMIAANPAAFDPMASALRGIA